MEQEFSLDVAACMIEDIGPDYSLASHTVYL